MAIKPAHRRAPEPSVARGGGTKRLWIGLSGLKSRNRHLKQQAGQGKSQPRHGSSRRLLSAETPLSVKDEQADGRGDQRQSNADDASDKTPGSIAERDVGADAVQQDFRRRFAAWQEVRGKARRTRDSRRTGMTRPESRQRGQPEQQVRFRRNPANGFADSKVAFYPNRRGQTGTHGHRCSAGRRGPSRRQPGISRVATDRAHSLTLGPRH
jgi:hypothetical protein